MPSLLSSLPFLRLGRPLPPTVPTDEVVPTHLFDDTETMRSAVMPWMFRFEDILDSEKLNSSLSQLFQMDGWRKFGGRFRLRPDGKLEVHIPTPFSEERPSVYFTKAHFDMRLRDHTEAVRLPKAAEIPTIYPCDREFTSLTMGPGAPWTFEDYIYSDRPQFSLHVVTFRDATLVSLAFAHISSDFGGLSAVVKAWSLVLAGKAEAVPPLVGFREDGMQGLWKSPSKEKHILAEKQLTGWRLAYWGLRFIIESWWRYDFKYHTLCIPKQTMDMMLLEARSHIFSNTGAEATSKKAFISEGDVLTALAFRTVAESLPPGSTREIMALISVDPRFRVKSLFREDAAYVQNAPAAALMSCTATNTLGMPLGRLAMLSRQTLTAQCTEEQLKALANMAAESIKAKKMEPVFGDKNMLFVLITNWSKGALLEKMDFSPAIVTAVSSSESTLKPGHPLYYNTASLHKGSYSVAVFSVAGRDHNGNMWISADLPERSWSALLGHLAKFTHGRAPSEAIPGIDIAHGL